VITPSHIIYSWAVAKASDSKPNKNRTLAIVTGSFLPDVPTYLFFFVHTFILGTAQQTMWDKLYFNSAWSPLITLSHSLLLWPILVLLSMLCKQKILLWVSTSATAHAVLDFFVHNDDAYRHFWPLSDWKFTSPVSYWDPVHFGTLFGLIDFVVVILLLSWLHTQYTYKWTLRAIRSLMVLYVVITFTPLFFFIFN